MHNTFVFSDPHFGHVGILTAKSRTSGRIGRPQFPSIEAMDEFIIDRWNSVVRDNDKVYCLGDVAMAERNLKYVRRLKGRKKLIMGNHDIFSARAYLDAGFYDVCGSRELDGAILTHIPINDINRRYLANVHGHLHDQELPDPYYLNVCVECIDYVPLAWEDAKRTIEWNQGKLLW